MESETGGGVFVFLMLLFVCFGVALCVHPSVCLSACVCVCVCVSQGSCVTSPYVDSASPNTNIIGF